MQVKVIFTVIPVPPSGHAAEKKENRNQNNEVISIRKTRNRKTNSICWRLSAAANGKTLCNRVKNSQFVSSVAKANKDTAAVAEQRQGRKSQRQRQTQKQKQRGIFGGCFFGATLRDKRYRKHGDPRVRNRIVMDPR